MVLVKSKYQMSYAIFCYSLDLSLPKSEYLSFDRELYSNNITGKIPIKLGSLTNLVSLELYLNKITGPIPEELGNLKNLRFLYEMLSLISYL